MGLVGYSDSESSDEETSKAADSQVKKDPALKRGFQKVVDRSNPSKIRVNLPDAPPIKHGGQPNDSEGPLAKKAKLGGGGLSGFNAMLPAPKRAAPSSSVNASSGSGLKKGISLKTGAAPAFTREAMPVPEEETETRDEDIERPPTLEDGDQPNSNSDASTIPSNGTPVQPKGKATMFKPLSVARRPQKLKKKVDTPSQNAAATPSTDASTSSPAPKPKPKVSLFGSYTEDDLPAPSVGANGDYQPALHQTEPTGEESQESAEPHPSASFAHPSSQSGAQSLDNIASDLNLSAAEKRQLFGRSGKGTGINVVTFDTDAEYKANEAFRANVEHQEVRNPVRAIAPGKHSLRQLVNAAVNQKDALEEQFATGRRNKKEAGSRYGW